MTQNTPPAPAMTGADTVDIDALVQDLEPVRLIRAHDGLVLALLVAAGCAAAIAASLGVRGDLANGVPHWAFFLRSATLLALGIGAATAVVATVNPAIGAKRPRWWRLALGVAMLYPAGAILTWRVEMGSTEQAIRALDPPYGFQCLTMSMLCAIAVGTAMVLWMRRGAPVNCERNGWLIGLASGSLGAAAYNIACSENVVIYIGTWYTLAVAAGTIAGRLIVPPLLRW